MIIVLLLSTVIILLFILLLALYYITKTMSRGIVIAIVIFIALLQAWLLHIWLNGNIV